MANRNHVCSGRHIGAFNGHSHSNIYGIRETICKQDCLTGCWHVVGRGGNIDPSTFLRTDDDVGRRVQECNKTIVCERRETTERAAERVDCREFVRVVIFRIQTATLADKCHRWCGCVACSTRNIGKTGNLAKRRTASRRIHRCSGDRTDPGPSKLDQRRGQVSAAAATGDGDQGDRRDQATTADCCRGRCPAGRTELNGFRSGVRQQHGFERECSDTALSNTFGIIGHIFKLGVILLHVEFLIKTTTEFREAGFGCIQGVVKH